MPGTRSNLRTLCPERSKHSVTQAGAAAARAGALLNAGKVTVESITAVVDHDDCNACGLCAAVCPYGAITADKKTKTKASVVEAVPSCRASLPL